MSGWDSLSWEAKRGAVLAQALFVCEICGEASATQVDHIWPRTLGGSHRRSNLRAACGPCNRQKGGQLWRSDIERQPHLVGDGVNDALRRAASALIDATRWTLYRESAGMCSEVDVAMSEGWDAISLRLIDAAIEAVDAEVHQIGPLSGVHAASQMFEALLLGVERRGES
jgi:hypothetical protein